MNCRTLPLSLSVLLLLCPTPSAQKPVKAKAADLTQSFDAAARYSESSNGLAVLIQKDGKVLYERYRKGYRMDKPQHLFSGTKSFAPCVAILAEKEGLLRLDEAVCETIHEWKGDKDKEKITIRHLLDFTHGLDPNPPKLRGLRGSDFYGSALRAKVLTPAGKRFRYGSTSLMVFGEVLRRKLAKKGKTANKKGKSPADFVSYLKEKILDKIDCKVAYWIRDSKGQPALPYGAYMTAREWAKFGQLLLDEGRYKGKQILPRKKLAECYRGSKTAPYYGLNFWRTGLILKARGTKGVPEELVAALGMYGQKLYLVPSQKLLILRLGRSPSLRRMNDGKFLKLVFEALPKSPARRRKKL